MGEHVPVARLHTPASWHESAGKGHTTPVQRLVPPQYPLVHTSRRVVASPSSHPFPFEAPHTPLVAAPAAVEHAWQSLVVPEPHTLLQHTPSTQYPEPQSPLSVQSEP